MSTAVHGRICLLRHAEAVDEQRDLPDQARHLSPAGRQQSVVCGRHLSNYFAAYLRNQSLPTDSMLFCCSPLVRAVQTAERAALAFGLEQDVTCHPLLAPGGDVRRLAKQLQLYPTITIVVGHEPGLSALGAVLTFNVDFLLLATAEAVFIDNGKEQWRWLHHDDAPKLSSS